jgi:hypothetical protein
LRGRAAARVVRELLTINTVPILLLTSGIGDIFALEADQIENVSSCELNQEEIHISAIDTEIVAIDRPSVEREFEFATADLQGKTVMVDRVLELARLAWWSIRNSPALAEPVELRRFVANLDRLAEDRPQDASMLTGLRQLLLREALRVDLHDQRFNPLLGAVARSADTSNLVVLVRNSHIARETTTRIADALGFTPDELRKLGIFVESVYASTPVENVGTCVVAGWFGTVTLDAALALRPRRLKFILDPLEARAAFLTAKRAIDSFQRLGIKEAITPVQMIAKTLEPQVIGFTETIDISLSFGLEVNAIYKTTSNLRPPAGEVGLYFTDGTRLDVSRHARLDVLGQGARQLKPLPADQLRAGDRVVLLDEDSQSIFSERLLEEVDLGILAPHAKHRANWKALVSTIQALRKPSTEALLQAMLEQGEPIDRATIRRWTADSNGAASVPDTWPRFVAFAKALDLQLPANTFREMYDSIQRCRVVHRTLGRELARATRGAYVGRLSAESLAKIERLCGITARQLVAGVRVLTIDEIVLPEEVTDAVE